MAFTRRKFVKRLLGVGVGAAAVKVAGAAPRGFKGSPEAYGVLVDLNACVGCRKCEWACNQNAKLPNQPIETFEDKTAFDTMRRTHSDTYTVVNRYLTPETDKPVYVKAQCMHCIEPACASACLVKAYTKTKEGAVAYNPDVCIGCRYCMAACPFDIPAYEYEKALTPNITKCTFCLNRIGENGGVPACVEICPVEALKFGKREELIEFAHIKMHAKPDKYIHHLYGEKEVGGTSWMYMSPVPFKQIGFREDLGERPIPEYSRGFLSMVSVVLVTWPALCIGFLSFAKRREKQQGEADKPAKEANDG